MSKPMLFGIPKKPRQKRKILMHVADAGNSGSCNVVFMKCGRCGHEPGWRPSRSVTEEKRGEPCPICNEEKHPAHAAAKDGAG